MLFDLSCDAKIASGKNKINGWTLSNKMAGVFSMWPGLRVELLRRYQDPAFSGCHPLIEEVLAKSPDEGVVLALVRNYAARKRPFDGRLHSAIRELALEQRPVSDWPGVYELYGVAVPELRKQLFEMTGREGEEARIATACLTAIAELRDENGYVDSEPRHPDIQAGRPWPMEIPS
jgi:hypothetical protein